MLQYVQVSSTNLIYSYYPIVVYLPDLHVPKRSGLFGAQLYSTNQNYLGLGTHLFVKVPRKETANGPFRSLSQAATCYYQFSHSKLGAIPLSALPKDTTSKLVGLS